MCRYMLHIRSRCMAYFPQREMESIESEIFLSKLNMLPQHKILDYFKIENMFWLAGDIYMYDRARADYTSHWQALRVNACELTRAPIKWSQLICLNILSTESWCCGRLTSPLNNVERCSVVTCLNIFSQPSSFNITQRMLRNCWEKCCDRLKKTFIHNLFLTTV